MASPEEVLLLEMGVQTVTASVPFPAHVVTWPSVCEALDHASERRFGQVLAILPDRAF